MINRRKFIGILGGGTILAAGGATAGFALTREPTRALAPWHEAGSAYSEPRKRALSYAILAPNPHNRQPWLVDLSEDHRITLRVDTDKLLPHTDPFSRQITIGLGCFLELLRMAAAADGYRAEMRPFPEGMGAQKLDHRPVAVIDMVKDPAIAKDPLFAQVLKRRSLKEPYDLKRPVSDEVIQRLKEVSNGEIAIGTTNDPPQVEALRSLTHAAMDIEIRTPRTYKESVELFRIGKKEVEANPDGIHFTGFMFEAMAALGLFNRETALDTSSTAYVEGIKAVMANCDTAMAYVWLVTSSNRREDQLNAGRDWLRTNLATTELGVGIHPMSQALQEYGEMEPLYQQCHAMLAPARGTVQMLGRLGYAAPVPPSPRWSLTHKIAKA